MTPDTRVSALPSHHHAGSAETLHFPAWTLRWVCLSPLCFSPGARAQVVLTQSSPEIKKPGESTKLTCAVSGFDLSSYTMYWFRQAPGKGLEWLLYYYSSSSNSYSPAIQGRFTASKDSSNFYLHMTSLKAEDTAVYYCARDTVRRRRSEWRSGATQQGAPGSKSTQPGQAGLLPLSSCPCTNKTLLPRGGLDWLGEIDWYNSQWRVDYAPSLQGRITLSAIPPRTRSPCGSAR
uniref:Ig-like domain-containing protein n=1 Tax=Terrapene triunguis TaxID=2587831 RepID=A0A674J7P3_9SAUR